MLEQVDLDKSLSRADHKARIAELAPRLRQLQVEHWHANVPTIIVFEGWDCSGKGECLGLLAEILDPRGFKMHPIFEPTAEEAAHPFLWRFWIQTPARGEIALFNRSWYQRLLTDRVDRVVRRAEWKRAFRQIADFERQLAADGTDIIKFFLHISKKEQRKRFRKFEADPNEAWRVRKEDWRHHKRYDDFVEATEEMLFRTDAHCAPWNILPAENLRYAEARMLEIVAERMQASLDAARAREAGRPSQDNPIPPPAASFAAPDNEPTILDRVDLTQKVDDKEYKEELRALQTRLRLLSLEMFRAKIPAIILYQGWDAAGKGGNIKRLTERLDPRNYDVISISKPNDEENAHHYLWRFWRQLPADGHIALFDRSWYGRVLVERIEGFCTEEEWRRAYQEINEFEADLAAHGMVLVKFYLHIDREEQARRFRQREQVAHKRWKIGPEDWRNREKWDHYEVAVVEMIQRTSTPHGPWTLVAANDKRFARLATLRTVIARFEAALGERAK